MPRNPLLLVLAPAALLCAGAPARAQDYVGVWEDPFNHDVTGFAEPPRQGRFNAIHLALIPVGPNRGKLLVMDEEVHVKAGADDAGAWEQRWSIVDVSVPGAPTFENHTFTLPDNEGDLFCAGHAWMPDGKLFVAGGTTQYLPAFVGGKLCATWDPLIDGNDAWQLLPLLTTARWYPTVTLMGDDRVVVSGGQATSTSHALNSYEVFDFGTQVWTELPGPTELDLFSIYPRAHVLASGEIFVAGFKEFGAKFHPETGWVGMNVMDSPRTYGSSVHIKLPNVPDVIAVVGGLGDVDLDTVEWCLPSSPDPVLWQWKEAPPLHNRRRMQNAVILPDGTIFVVGGMVDGEASPFVRTPEVYAAFEWHEQPKHHTPRDYHSTALLLPDGRVLSAAGDQRGVDYQVFRPHYLAPGKERPVILSAPDELDYQSETPQLYTIEVAPLSTGTVQSVVLMHPGSVTHHNDYDQRMIRLEVVGGSATGISFGAPLTSNDAPRGTYMLFVLSSERVPSVARWVHID